MTSLPRQNSFARDTEEAEMSDERRAEIEAAQKRISEGNVNGEGWAEAVAVVARHEHPIPDRAVVAAINTFVTYRGQSGEYGAMRLALGAARPFMDDARSPQGEDHEDNGSPPGEDHQKLELAFWGCGHIEVDVGVRHLCDDRDVCRATYVPYVRVSAPKADENQEAR